MGQKIRFASMADVKAHIKANKLKVKEQHSNRRGQRIQVVDPKGNPRTLVVENADG